MNTVERVKAICKERKIPIYKLEQDCGFANGYIGQLKKGTIPDVRLRKIAEYLDLSIEYLITGEEKTNEGYYISTETAKIAQEIFMDPNLRALFSAAQNSRPQDLRLAADMLTRFKETNPDG